MVDSSLPALASPAAGSLNRGAVSNTTTEASLPRRAQDGRVRLRTLTRVYPGPPMVVRLEGRLVLGREPGPGGLTLDDGRCSRQHAELAFVPTYGLYRLRDLDSRNGTFLNAIRCDDALLRHGSVIRVGGTLLVYADVALEPGLPDVVPDPVRSLHLLRAQALAERVAPTLMPVLVQGPTGAGKERLTAHLHAKSGRTGQLVAVNCGALNKELLGSELFGHVRGAFSGAQGNREGLFAAAHGGTLFLDEVGELPLDMQPALLRTLQEGRIRPVGADRDRVVDVRVVAATHRDLEALQAEGRFREDLYARLAGLVIEVPGLADRREEILPLLAGFLGPTAPPLTPEAAEALLVFEWPHNIRELRFTAERIALFAAHVSEITPALLPSGVTRVVRAEAAQATQVPDRDTLAALLAEHEGNVAGVARALDQHRQQVYRWLRVHQLEPADYRRPG